MRGFHIRHDVLVREHHPFRLARGSRGINQRSDIRRLGGFHPLFDFLHVLVDELASRIQHIIPHRHEFMIEHRCDGWFIERDDLLQVFAIRFHIQGFFELDLG